MKKSISILAVAALLFCGCTLTELPTTDYDESPVFYSSFEEPDGTKTYVDSQYKLLWNADDRLSIFTTTLNEQYVFNGKTGDNSGTFSKVPSSQFGTGNTISTNYAVYPYSASTSLNNDETITVELPSVQGSVYRNQSYSFAPGSNTMVAVTKNPTDYFLPFKNICGYLVLKLYGEGTIKTITITGNNGERLSGRAKVTVSNGSEPTTNVLGYNYITIDCGDNCQLFGDDPSDTRDFWFCIPPTTFSNGFTISITSTDGKLMSKTIQASKTIERNVVNTMSPLKVVFTDDLEYAEIEDPGLESFLLANYDTDGDGRISTVEAVTVSTLYYDEKVTSLSGLEFFPNIKIISLYPTGIDNLDLSDLQNLEDCTISIDGVALTSINFSGLNKLTTSRIFRDSDEDVLSSVNFQDCSALKNVSCINHNKLENINLAGCTSLEKLTAYWCDISEIDLSGNIKLKKLYLSGNPLTSIDLSNNTELEWAAFHSTNIETLDITNNIKLETLYHSNQNIIGGSSLSFLEMIVQDCENYTVPSNFQNVKTLHLWSAEGESLDYYDISACTQLEEFWTSYRQLNNIVFGSAAASIKKLELDHISGGNLSIDFSPFTSLEVLKCDGGTFSSLDVSPLSSTLKDLNCVNSPDLHEIWLATGQTIENFFYDTDIATIKYK